MKKLSVLLLFAAAAQIILISAVIADEVPNFDIQKNCSADSGAYGSAASRTGCVADEQKAKATLVVRWSRFSAASKSRCMSMVNDIAGGQSYVELLTCLQVAKYAPR
jgi:hypothetical protein